MGQPMRKLSTQEIRKRLNRDGGYLKEKVKTAGYEALFNVITSEKCPPVSLICNDLLFLTRIWLDQNGDEISQNAKNIHFRKRGIKDFGHDQNEFLEEKYKNSDLHRREMLYNNSVA